LVWWRIHPEDVTGAVEVMAEGGVVENRGPRKRYMGFYDRTPGLFLPRRWGCTGCILHKRVNVAARY
jgi:hypothetical protein